MLPQLLAAGLLPIFPFHKSPQPNNGVLKRNLGNNVCKSAFDKVSGTHQSQISFLRNPQMGSFRPKTAIADIKKKTFPLSDV